MDPSPPQQLSKGAMAVRRQILDAAELSRHAAKHGLYVREGKSIILFRTAEERDAYIQRTAPPHSP